MTERLKILHTNFNIGWGGQSNRVFNVCSGLKKLGHDVILACPEKSDLRQKAEDHGLNVLSNVRFNSGLNVSDYRDYRYIKALIKKERFDIIHTHGSKDSWVGVLASKASGIDPLIVRTRHNIFPVSTHYLNRLLFKKWTDEIVVICKFLEKDFLGRGLANAGHISVIHSGLIDSASDSEVSAGQFRRDFKIDEDEIIIGMCANIVWYKGHRFFAEASGEITRKYPNTRFVILGDGIKEIKDDVINRFKKNGTYDRLIMPGFYDKMPAFYKSCDILIHPALSEGCCNVILEAFSHGIPVVASNVGGIPDMVEDHITGILIPSEDHGSIIRGVFEILGNRKLKEDMVKSARKKFLDDFSVDKMVKLTEELYIKAIEYRGK